MSAPLFLLDTSVFTQAARSYYAFDIAPSFWKAILTHAGKGKIISIDRVKDEIDRGNDQLKRWLNDHFTPFIQSTQTADIVHHYGEIIRWASGQPQYRRAAINEFAAANNADAWVVAFAKARNLIVVTQEASSLQSKKSIKIPDVCRAHQIKSIDTFELMRRLNIKI
ncbi:DUF4411 family protein [Hydrogenibacillus sp. N12]|uniref:DUF4411 family protein n=1 Tax=Hydrogenibacillus sp. N12 TaxID=2866627 RepID=UPI001C7CE155|nr:DUF4411 family protein [Hydrogenibacillus sp. N12]QZA33267.1 DUF4411 family protein [Hydrogenibacillus sp. N12]